MLRSRRGHTVQPTMRGFIFSLNSPGLFLWTPASRALLHFFYFDRIKDFARFRLLLVIYNDVRAALFSSEHYSSFSLISEDDDRALECGTRA